jgi:hypothetical protein
MTHVDPDDAERVNPDPALGRQRRDLDAAQQAGRAAADAKKNEKRELRDSTRQEGRGGGQAREGLRREREAADASLDSERARADVSRQEDREFSDATIAREKEARVHAEAGAQQILGRDIRRTRELREVLVLVRAEFDVITENLTQVLMNVPRGPYEASLSESVGKIRTASDRVQYLLKDALDPEDARGRHHDEGGSG